MHFWQKSEENVPFSHSRSQGSENILRASTQRVAKERFAVDSAARRKSNTPRKGKTRAYWNSRESTLMFVWQAERRGCDERKIQREKKNPRKSREHIPRTYSIRNFAFYSDSCDVSERGEGGREVWYRKWGELASGQEKWLSMGRRRMKIENKISGDSRKCGHRISIGMPNPISMPKGLRGRFIERQVERKFILSAIISLALKSRQVILEFFYRGKTILYIRIFIVNFSVKKGKKIYYIHMYC